jgi:probable phosphoglycerate mutase
MAVWLVRHGETEWSRSGRHTGRTEVELTDRGREQAIALRPVLADLHPALVLCSPRVRARQTAELAGLAVDDIDADLAEWDYGDYEGRTRQEIRQTQPGWNLWSDGVPNGETAEQVGERADRVLDRARAAQGDGAVVLVGHGHMSRVLGVRWIGLSVADGGRFALSTAAPSILDYEHESPVISRWNLPNPATSNGTAR